MNDITLEISNQLAKIVHDATIYREQTEQKFEEPCFYIYEVSSNAEYHLAQYQLWTHLYCVMWFPDSKSVNPGTKEQCEAMRLKLMDEFDFIDKIRVKVLDREFKVNDGALQFTFKLQYRVAKTNDAAIVKIINLKGGIVGG